MNTSQPIQPDIVEKIEKLMNLAGRAGTEGEAKAAFAAASKLMTKYGIEQHQLTGRTDFSKGGGVQAPKFERVDIDVTKYDTERPYHLFIRRILRHCFCVTVMKMTVFRAGRNGANYYMLGTREDCLFAGYAFDALSGIFKNLLSRYVKEHGLVKNRAVSNGYWQGLETGFCQAWDEAKRAEIKAQNADAFAIVLVDKSKALTLYVNALPGIRHVKTHRSMDGHAYQQGVRDGRNISIHRPLAGGSSNSNAQLGR